MKKIRLKINKNKFRSLTAYSAVALWALFAIALNFIPVLKIPLVIFIFISVSAIYLFDFYPASIKGSHKQLALALLLSVGYVVCFAVVNYAHLSAYWLPVAAIPMLVILLFNQPEIALFMAMAMSIITGIISGDFILATIFLIGGIAGICASWQARRRSQLVVAGCLVGLAQFFTFAFFNGFKLLPQYVLYHGLILGVNGIIAMLMVMFLLPLFESLFNVVTNISLLELSDINHSLIKKMILEAPGTYHHSLLVSNLSEAAAQAIGANALLARVGAYFHDIGKIEKAKYFSENQKDMESEHEDLSPSMSKLIIMNHVKDGVELAQKYHLKPAIIDFINQHHGRSLVYYFYRRAIVEGESDQEVQEEPFRYPGPKPQTRETAIVLLADSVEAASRSIDDPTPARIKEVVKKMINNKFIDGQLDECDLTLKDLEVIANAFTHILSGIYHSRIDYPDQNENKHKKSAKHNSHKSSSNHKDFKGSS